MKSLSILITFNNPTAPPPQPQSTYTALAMYFFKKRVDKTYINFQDKQACIQHGTASCAVSIQFGLYTCKPTVDLIYMVLDLCRRLIFTLHVTM